MFCLDTNIVIAAINTRTPEVRRRIAGAIGTGKIVAVPTIVLYEIRFGIRKSAKPQENTAKLELFLTSGVVPWTFDAEDAEEGGEIRAELERLGTPIGPYDVLIAAQARRRRAALVTANTGEFTRVSGLSIEDWTKP